MAATITNEYLRWVSRDFVGASPKQVAIYQVTLDSSYPTGGEAADFTALAPFSAVDIVMILGVDAGGRHIEWDISAGKFVVYESGTADAALDEINAATDLSAVTITVMVIGDE